MQMRSIPPQRAILKQLNYCIVNYLILILYFIYCSVSSFNSYSLIFHMKFRQSFYKYKI